MRILDPAISRLYIISQLSLQYLLFCTKLLDKTVHSLRENIFNYLQKVQKLEAAIGKRDEEIAQLEKKLKRQAAINQPIFPCTKCTKNFLSAALLDNHILRKHPVQESIDKDSNLINTIKLELEIKQLKEKLNATEKELMEVNGKPMECAKCCENSQRRFQSVAIQSNFEEKEKDDVEKDAVLEMLNEQKKHFEKWKRQEETNYRAEVSQLRNKLDETIAMLKENAEKKEVPAPPSPAPRRMVKAMEPPDESVWKDRYEELEKMHEQHQQRMASTVQSIENAFNKKLAMIEESQERARQQLEASLKKQEINPAGLPAQLMQEKFSTESSSESEVKSIPVAPMEPPKPVQQPKPAMETFAAQKFLIRPTKPAKASPPKATREDAEELYKKRLDLLGVAQNSHRMTKADFNRVQSDMVNIRDGNKKKHKSFFIIRKSLQSKVDKIFHQNREGKPKEVQKKIEEQAKEKPKESGIVTREFRDDLERIYKQPLPVTSSLTKPEPTPREPAPSTSKKKVLFNLDNERKTFNEIREIKEDDSDFDLSSFSTEAEEFKIRESL